MNDERGCAVISSLFDYVMVDEYQDINKLQNDILNHLVNVHRNVAVVGDDYQSIYAFRGSNVKYIERYERENPDSTSVTIDMNYRSSDEIIEFVNEVMHRECHFGIKKDMKGTGIKSGPVRILHVNDEEDECQHILGEIILNHNKGVSYDQIAVLGRTSLRFTKLELLLTKNGIPYKMLGGSKFLDRVSIRDLMAIITCIIRPTNKTSRLKWYRILNSLVRGVGDVTANELCEDFETKDFLLLPKNQGSSFSKGIVALNTALNQFEINAENDYFGTLEQITKWYMDTKRELIMTAKRKIESNRTEELNQLNDEQAAIDMFLEIAQDYGSLSDLLDGLSLSAVVKDRSSEVVLSTVHSAKGLEWNHVYMIDVVDYVYPGKKMDEEENEELRLFYVAMTRAKRQLSMYVPQYYRSRYGYIETEMSRFICSAVKANLDVVKESEISRYDILHHQKLDFEMIPDTLNGKNARSLLTKKEWDTISKNVRRIGVCACCMKQTPSQNLDAHEVWTYDDNKHVQSLLDIIPVCSMCHDTNHIGNSVKSGRRTELELLEHYCDVNDVSLKQAKNCLDAACNMLTHRNDFIWKQNEDSIRNVATRYISTEHKTLSDEKEIHYVHGVSFYQKDEFKDWCNNHNITWKWDAIKKSWGYFGPLNEELERVWNQ